EYAAAQLGDGPLDRDAGGLGQLADAGEAARVQPHDAGDEVVADLCPAGADGLVAGLVLHRRGPRGEDRQVDAPFGHQRELAALDGRADVIVGNARVRRRRDPGREGLLLCRAPVRVSLRRGRVVTVAVDDHRGSWNVGTTWGGTVILLAHLIPLTFLRW